MASASLAECARAACVSTAEIWPHHTDVRASVAGRLKPRPSTSSPLPSARRGTRELFASLAADGILRPPLPPAAQHSLHPASLAADGTLRPPRSPAAQHYLNPALVALQTHAVSRGFLRPLPPASAASPPHALAAVMDAAVPPRRADAIQLTQLLEALLHSEEGNWAWRSKVHDAVFSEVVLQVGVHCAERGELLNRLRQFYGKQSARLDEQDAAVRASRARVAELQLELEATARRGAASEEKAFRHEQHAEALRVSLARLKLLRLVHSRKLQLQTVRNARLEARVQQLEAAMESGDLAVPQQPSEELFPPNRKGRRNSIVEVLPVRGGIASRGEGEEETGGWRKKLAAMHEENDRLHAELEGLQVKLSSSEQEVSALIFSIKKQTESSQSVAAARNSVAVYTDDTLVRLHQINLELKQHIGRLQLEREKDHKAAEALKKSLAEAAKTIEEKDAEMAKTRKDAVLTNAALKWERSLAKENARQLAKLRRSNAADAPSKAVQTDEGRAESIALHMKRRLDVSTQTVQSGPTGRQSSSQDVRQSHAALFARGALPRASSAVGSPPAAPPDAPPDAPRDAPPLEKAPSEAAASAPLVQDQRKRRARLVREIRTEANAMSQWVVLKVASMMIEGKIEQERTLRLESPDEEGQDLSEFVEDKFVQLYGIRKVAEEHLHALALGLLYHSESHRRLRIFRSLTDLVPGDQPRSHLTSEFYALVLRAVVDSIAEDHLSGVTAAVFWKHFGRNNAIVVPTVFLDRATDKLAAHVRASQAEATQGLATSQASSTRQLLLSKRLWCSVQTLECAMKAMEAIPELPSASGQDGKLALQGSVTGAHAVLNVGIGVYSNAHKVDLDLFIELALNEWLSAEANKHKLIVEAAATWASGSARTFTFESFSEMLWFSNPDVVTSTKISQMFTLVAVEDCINTDKLGWTLLSNGLQLLPKPADEAIVAESISLPAERATRRASITKVALNVLTSFRESSENLDAFNLADRRDEDIDHQIEEAIQADEAARSKRGSLVRGSEDCSSVASGNARSSLAHTTSEAESPQVLRSSIVSASGMATLHEADGCHNSGANSPHDSLDVSSDSSSDSCSRDSHECSQEGSDSAEGEGCSNSEAESQSDAIDSGCEGHPDAESNVSVREEAERDEPSSKRPSS